MDLVRLDIDAVKINIAIDWDHIMNRQVITKMTTYLCLQGIERDFSLCIFKFLNFNFLFFVLIFVRNNTQSTSVDTIDGPMSCGIRRHSIGTFVGRDKRCGSISDEVRKLEWFKRWIYLSYSKTTSFQVPKTYAPKPPVQMQNSLNSKVDRKASEYFFLFIFISQFLKQFNGGNQVNWVISFLKINFLMKLVCFYLIIMVMCMWLK